MDSLAVDRLVKQLTADFDALQDEYQKLHGQHEALEMKLATAREQVRQYYSLYTAFLLPSRDATTLALDL